MNNDQIYHRTGIATVNENGDFVLHTSDDQYKLNSAATVAASGLNASKVAQNSPEQIIIPKSEVPDPVKNEWNKYKVVEGFVKPKNFSTLRRVSTLAVAAVLVAGGAMTASYALEAQASSVGFPLLLVIRNGVKWISFQRLMTMKQSFKMLASMPVQLLLRFPRVNST
ncbi:hypothetical protein BDR26DRAFT_858771 [Obelidium mucronatum]|nr:hypothetical protein BDR26DRAFT_858771 [Obelidium mucronatum]